MVRQYCKHPDGCGRVIEEQIDTSSSMVQVVVRPRPLRKGCVFDSKTTRSMLDHAHFAREVCSTRDTSSGICGYIENKTSSVFMKLTSLEKKYISRTLKDIWSPFSPACATMYRWGTPTSAKKYSEAKQVILKKLGGVGSGSPSFGSRGLSLQQGKINNGGSDESKN